MNYVPITRGYAWYNARFQEIKAEAKTPPYLIDLIERANMLYRDLRFVRDLPNVINLMNAIRELVNSMISILLIDTKLIEELIEYNDFKCEFAKSGFLEVGNTKPEFSKETQYKLIEIAVAEFKSMGGHDDFDRLVESIREFDAMKAYNALPRAPTGKVGGAYTRKRYARRNKKGTRSFIRKHKNAKFA
jgi:hypothetical protein